jgi:hypothetical protein
MADVNRFDQAARYFVRTDPPAVLAWALDSAPADFRFAGWLDTRSVPFPGETDRVGDLVARVERADPPGEPWLVAVEVQIQPDPLMFGRLLEYLGRPWQAEKPSSERGDRYRLGAVVINLTGIGRASQDFEWLPTGPRTCLRVAERNPARESAADTLAAIVGGTLSPALLPLIPLMRGGGEPGIIEAWVRLASAESDSRRRSEHGALALVFAEAAGVRPVWKEALKDWNMVESQQVLEWQAEARAEGEARGRLRATGAALIRFLEARFHTIPQELIDRIRAMSDVERLAGLVSLAGEAPSLDQFRADAGL